MARVRRKASPKARLNFEIAGIAAIGLAVLIGIALLLPHGTGVVGFAARGLWALFGGAAPLFPVLVALFGAIVFLEINVPRMMATLGAAALAYFLLLDASLARRGGAVGAGLWYALQKLAGVAGARVIVGIAALLLAVWITNVSVKKVIGWTIASLAAVRWSRIRLTAPAPRAVQPDAPARDVRAIVPVEAFVPPAAAPVEIEWEDVIDHDAVPEPDEPEPEEPPQAEQDLDYDAAPRAKVLYRLPDLSLFDPPPMQIADDASRSHVLEDTLGSFGVGAKVVHIERGPSITRYELRPDRGVKISKIASLADDLALALAATSVRIEAPIPGKSAVGIEVPNKTVSIVAVREILETLPGRGQIPPLWMALGKDITGRPVFGDLGKMPHLLVAGATGAGKSVCLNTIVASLLVSATPDQVQLLMIDPKRVELTMYNGIPHLIKDVITDARMAAGALFEMTKEMDARYERFAKAGVRKIEEYNARFPGEHLPYVVVIIDELADLMLVAPARVETSIMRLAQLARATGIHLVVATQRPSVDVITGLIKANIPSRIAFAVSSQVDSRTILDMAGAERLLGRGDMLYLPIDAPKPVRAQGALITGSEVHRLVDFWAKQSRPENLLDVDVVPITDDDGLRKDVDPLCYDAAKFIIESNYASTAALQSQFSIGHPRAVRVMKQLEDFKVVGPHEGTKPRRILISVGDLETIAPRLGRDGGQQDLFATGS
ncbi:MAG TPA: DNA translocase FtsK [Candidatus Baltobacteraceae bacterium]|nr:DNA translocase FtsK [Candidatus Baltobacteraceae bacterium]